MTKVKRVKIDDYVLITKYSDKDFTDPWNIGLISEFGEDKKGLFYRVGESNRYYRHCWKVTKEEAEEILNNF